MRLRINEGLALHNFTNNDYALFDGPDLPSGKESSDMQL